MRQPATIEALMRRRTLPLLARLLWRRLSLDVWTAHREGCGKFCRTSGDPDIAIGIQDLKATMPIVAKRLDEAKSISFPRPREASGPPLLQSSIAWVLCVFI
jgi:hypothetical protein